MNIAEELAGAKTVGITGHVRPDGDCVGSCMGLYNYIIDNMPGIQVDVYLESLVMNSAISMELMR